MIKSSLDGRIEIGYSRGRRFTALVARETLTQHLPSDIFSAFVLKGMKSGKVVIEVEESRNNEIFRNFITRKSLLCNKTSLPSTPSINTVGPQITALPPAGDAQSSAALPLQRTKAKTENTSKLYFEQFIEGAEEGAVTELSEDELEELDQYITLELQNSEEAAELEKPEQDESTATAGASYFVDSQKVFTAPKKGNEDKKTEVDLIFARALKQIQSKRSHRHNEEQSREEDRTRTEDKKRLEKQEHEDHHRIRKEEVKRSDAKHSDTQRQVISANTMKTEHARDEEPPRKLEKPKSR